MPTSKTSPPESEATSPTRGTHSRTPSYLLANPHAPVNPSGLREAHTLSVSPDDRVRLEDSRPTTSESLAGSEDSRARTPDMSISPSKAKSTWLGRIPAISETTSLLRKPLEIVAGRPHEGPCNHGTFSPGLDDRASLLSDDTGDLRERGFSNRQGLHRQRKSTTARLAEENGLKINPAMYITYYVPFFAWIRQYQLSYLHGDLIAAITVASFYIPMALSLAANLGHIPPINGLYSFVFNPFIYALLGSCPQMVVGPEAAGSLLVGSVVRSTTDSGNVGDDDGAAQAQIAGIVTGLAGAVIFIGGITRLGFLENVLSRPFMRGFISSIGFIIFVDQLLVLMKLNKVAEQVGGITHGSTMTKLGFLLSYLDKAHKLTTAVGLGSFAVIMVLRELKKRLQPRYPQIAYVPDRFLVVVLSAVLCYQLSWDQKGLDVLGVVEPAVGGIFSFIWPFQMKYMKIIRTAMSTSFVIALLGFFESSVAAKALGDPGRKSGDGIKDINLSPNRELVALGVANVVAGCFMSLPGFGGYGRSKVNASTGGKTPMSSIFLSLITMICITWLLPYFYYLPKAVLSALIAAVAWSLVEEAPHDISFFIRIRAYRELLLMAAIFVSTIFYSLNLGIATGIGLSLLQVLHHSTKPRIQILGRRPGTNRYEAAEEHPENFEFVEGCLIVKIPEPLTFANTGDLKNRLRRLEYYGTTAAHPALPRVRADHHNRNVIFDIHGVTGLDGSGAQVLAEIVEGYEYRGVRVFFSRGPTEGEVWELLKRSGIIDSIGGMSHYVNDVGDALRLTEQEEFESRRSWDRDGVEGTPEVRQ